MLKRQRFFDILSIKRVMRIFYLSYFIQVPISCLEMKCMGSISLSSKLYVRNTPFYSVIFSISENQPAIIKHSGMKYEYQNFINSSYEYFTIVNFYYNIIVELKCKNSKHCLISWKGQTQQATYKLPSMLLMSEVKLKYIYSELL